MSKESAGQGRCVCGAVEVDAPSLSDKIGACHCSTCRNWGGGPFLSSEGGEGVSFSGDSQISVYDSSEWADRGFCNQCGTHLFYRLKDTGQYFLPIGLFPHSEQWVFDHQVFIDEKPSYYCFSNATQDMTGAQLFAQFSETGEDSQ